VITLASSSNWIAGALLAFTIFFYVVIYTMALKRWTAQNIVIGGAAGALPPVVAWAAATGSVSVEPLLLFLIIFFWTRRISGRWRCSVVTTMPAPACRCCPSSPVPMRRGGRSCSIRFVLVAVAAAPWPLGYFDAVYGVTSLVLGGGMLALAVSVYRHRQGSAALRATRKLFAFHSSICLALFATC